MTIAINNEQGINRKMNSPSWMRAYLDGLNVAKDHRVFTLLAILSLGCERSLYFFAHYTGISLKTVALNYQEMLSVLLRDPLDGYKTLPDFMELYAFLPVALGLFALGVFILVGVLGLLRDLLIKYGYRTENLVYRGKEYLWPIVKFKMPIYITLAVLFLSIASVVMTRYGYPRQFMTYVMAGASIYLIIFFIARIFLSLGPKIIVTEETEKVLPVYRRIVTLIHPHLRTVTTFYFVMFIVTGTSLLLPFGLSLLKLPFFLSAMASLFLFSFVTVVIKASSFSLYLQLRSLQVCETEIPGGGFFKSIRSGGRR